MTRDPVEFQSLTRSFLAAPQGRFAAGRPAFGRRAEPRA